MTSVDIAGIFTAGMDVIGAELKGNNNTIIFRLGDAANQVTEAEAEIWGPFGLASMPAVADASDPNGAAQTLAINTTNYHLIIGGRDARTQKLYGKLSPGDTALYCSGQGRVLLKKDGSASLFTRKGNADGGKGMGLFMTPDGNITLLNDQGFGIMLTKDGIVLTTGTAAVSINADGTISIVGTGAVQMDGTSVTLGSIAVPGVNSALVGITGIAGVASTKVLIQL